MAVDIDTAAHTLGRHVESEYQKRCREETRSKSKPTGDSPKPLRPGRSANQSRKHYEMTDERRSEIWSETVSRIVDGKIVFYYTPRGKTGRWRVEKIVTGDKVIDSNQAKGARTVFDDEGRKRAQFDASNKQIFSWTPSE